MHVCLAQLFTAVINTTNESNVRRKEFVCITLPGNSTSLRKVGEETGSRRRYRGH